MDPQHGQLSSSMNEPNRIVGNSNLVIRFFLWTTSAPTNLEKDKQQLHSHWQSGRNLEQSVGSFWPNVLFTYNVECQGGMEGSSNVQRENMVEYMQCLVATRTAAL